MSTKKELLEELTLRELKQLLKENQITLVKKRFFKDVIITKKDEMIETILDNNIHIISKEKILAVLESRDKKKQTGTRKVRKSIPKSVKESVWNKYIGPDKAYGNCYVCDKIIHITDFEVGHNKAVAKGGKDNLNNLRPICGTCNKSMGTMSIETYKKKYFSLKNESKVIEPKQDLAVIIDDKKSG